MSKTYAVMTEAERKKLLHRIHALLAKQGTEGTTPEEELLAGEFARRLMDRYDVSLQDIGREDENDIQTHFIDMGTGNNSHPIKFCMISLGEYCDVRCWRVKRWSREKEMRTVHRVLFGRAHDVKIADYLFHVILKGMERELTSYKRSSAYEQLSRPGKTSASRSFMTGVAVRIDKRLVVMLETRKAALEELINSTSLITMKQQNLDRLVEEIYGKLGPVKKVSMAKEREKAAYSYGYVAGGHIQLVAGLMPKTG